MALSDIRTALSNLRRWERGKKGAYADRVRKRIAFMDEIIRRREGLRTLTAKQQEAIARLSGKGVELEIVPPGTPKPVPKPVPKPAPKPVPKPAPKPELGPEPIPQPKPAPKTPFKTVEEYEADLAVRTKEIGELKAIRKGLTNTDSPEYAAVDEVLREATDARRKQQIRMNALKRKDKAAQAPTPTPITAKQPAAPAFLPVPKKPFKTVAEYDAELAIRKTEIDALKAARKALSKDSPDWAALDKTIREAADARRKQMIRMNALKRKEKAAAPAPAPAAKPATPSGKRGTDIDTEGKWAEEDEHYYFYSKVDLEERSNAELLARLETAEGEKAAAIRSILQRRQDRTYGLVTDPKSAYEGGAHARYVDLQVATHGDAGYGALMAAYRKNTHAISDRLRTNKKPPKPPKSQGKLAQNRYRDRLDEWNYHTRMIESLEEASEPIPIPTTLYRGMKVDKDDRLLTVKIGETVPNEKQILSTSLDHRVAEDYAATADDSVEQIVMVIRAKKGTKGFLGAPAREEVTLSPPNGFRVIGRKTVTVKRKEKSALVRKDEYGKEHTREIGKVTTIEVELVDTPAATISTTPRVAIPDATVDWNKKSVTEIWDEIRRLRKEIEEKVSETSYSPFSKTRGDLASFKADDEMRVLSYRRDRLIDLRLRKEKAARGAPGDIVAGMGMKKPKPPARSTPTVGYGKRGTRPTGSIDNWDDADAFGVQRTGVTLSNKDLDSIAGPSSDVPADIKQKARRIRIGRKQRKHGIYYDPKHAFEGGGPGPRYYDLAINTHGDMAWSRSAFDYSVSYGDVSREMRSGNPSNTVISLVRRMERDSKPLPQDLNLYRAMAVKHDDPVLRAPVGDELPALKAPTSSSLDPDIAAYFGNDAYDELADAGHKGVRRVMMVIRTPKATKAVVDIESAEDVVLMPKTRLRVAKREGRLVDTEHGKFELIEFDVVTDPPPAKVRKALTEKQQAAVAKLRKLQGLPDDSDVAAGISAAPQKLNTAAMTKVGGQKGSNPGGVYEDAAGQKYYVKTPHSPVHGAEELLASRLYRAAGVDVVDLRHADNGKIASPIVPGIRDINEVPIPMHTVEGVAEGFGADVLFANWDTVGTGYSNLVARQVGGKWKAMRIDVGGSLEYRAQGAPKGAAFGNKLTEIKGFRDPHLNYYSAEVFKPIDEAVLRKSARDVAARLSEADIRRLVAEEIKQPARAKKITDTLIARRKALQEWGEEGMPKGASVAPKAKPAPTPQPVPKPPTPAPTPPPPAFLPVPAKPYKTVLEYEAELGVRKKQIDALKAARKALSKDSPDWAALDKTIREAADARRKQQIRMNALKRKLKEAGAQPAPPTPQPTPAPVPAPKIEAGEISPAFRVKSGERGRNIDPTGKWKTQSSQGLVLDIEAKPNAELQQELASAGTEKAAAIRTILQRRKERTYGLVFDPKSAYDGGVTPRYVDLQAATHGDVKYERAMSAYRWQSQQISAALRLGRKLDPEQQKIVDGVETLSAPLPAPVTLYRGMAAEKNDAFLTTAIGEKVPNDKQILSTSIKRAVAEDYAVHPTATAGHGEQIVLVIRTPQGTKAVVGTPQRAEVTLMPPNEFRIIGRKTVQVDRSKRDPLTGGHSHGRPIGKITTVEVEIVPDAAKAVPKPKPPPPVKTAEEIALDQIDESLKTASGPQRFALEQVRHEVRNLKVPELAISPSKLETVKQYEEQLNELKASIAAMKALRARHDSGSVTYAAADRFIRRQTAIRRKQQIRMNALKRKEKAARDAAEKEARRKRAEAEAAGTVDLTVSSGQKPEQSFDEFVQWMKDSGWGEPIPAFLTRTAARFYEAPIGWLRGQLSLYGDNPTRLIDRDRKKIIEELIRIRERKGPPTLYYDPQSVYDGGKSHTSYSALSGSLHGHDGNLRAIRRTLPSEDRSLIENYHADGYQRINGALRDPGSYPRTVLRNADRTVEAFEKHSAPLQENLLVYRSVKARGDLYRRYDRMRTGDTISDEGFLSTTVNSEFAESWAHSAPAGGGDPTPTKPVIFVIRVPKGTKASALNLSPTEQEVTLLPKTKLKLTNKRHTLSQHDEFGGQALLLDFEVVLPPK